MDDLSNAQAVAVTDVGEFGIPTPPLTEMTRAQRLTNALLNSTVLVGSTDIVVAPALPGSYPTYRAMLRDPTIALARAVASAPVLAASWSYEARDGVSDDRVRFVRRIMEAHALNLKKQCLRAWDFGCQSFELVWEAVDKELVGVTEEDGELPDTLFRLKKIKPLLPDLTSPLLDIHGNLIALRNGWTTSGTGLVGSGGWTNIQEGDLVAGKFFHYAYEQIGDDPYGMPRLEAVRDTWNEWRDANENLKKLARKSSGTVAVGHYPVGESKTATGETVSNYTAMVNVLRSLVAGNAVAVPNFFAGEDNLHAAKELAGESAWKFDFLDSGNTGPAISGLIEALGHKDSRKMRGYLVPERAATEAQLAGSRADSESQGDIGVIVAELFHQELVNAINKGVVDWLLQYNFGPEAIGSVYIVPAKLNDSTRAFFANLFNQLMSNPATVDYILRKLDVDAIFDLLDLPKVEEVVDDSAVIGGENIEEGLDPTQQGAIEDGQGAESGQTGLLTAGEGLPEVVGATGAPGQGIQTKLVSEGQSVAATTENLRATVGGSAAVRELQMAYYAGKIPREACIANATLVFGFKPDESAQLFPEIAPKALVEPPPNPFANPNADPNAPPDPNVPQLPEDEENPFEKEDGEKEGKKRRPFDMAREEEDDSEGVWRTIHGRAVFIKDGEDLGSAMERAGMKGENKGQLSSLSDKDVDALGDWGRGNIVDLVKRVEAGKLRLEDVPNDADPTGESSLTSREAVDRFLKIVKNAPQDYSGTVYRGLAVTRAAQERMSKVGHVVTIDSLSSASKDISAAQDYTRSPLTTKSSAKERVIMQIKTNKGVDLEKIWGNEGEREVLLPRGTKFKVVNVKYNHTWKEGNKTKSATLLTLEPE